MPIGMLDPEWAKRLAGARPLIDPAEPLGDAHLHHGPASARAAESLGAEAFAVGQDIFFGEGQYTPESDQGQALLAHELVHVRQQTAPPLQRADDPEVEARAAESGRALSVETFQRAYAGDLTVDEIARLDELSLRAIGLAERLLTDRSGGGMLRVARAEVAVEVDLDAPDDAIVEVWAGAIAEAVRREAT
jgi:hypothetical protein